MLSKNLNKDYQTYWIGFWSIHFRLDQDLFSFFWQSYTCSPGCPRSWCHHSAKSHGWQDNRHRTKLGFRPGIFFLKAQHCYFFTVALTDIIKRPHPFLILLLISINKISHNADWFTKAPNPTSSSKWNSKKSNTYIYIKLNRIL